MFTGIVEEIGVVREISAGRLVIDAKEVIKGTRDGDSIAVNGVCLTVISKDAGSFCVDVMPETVRRTNICRLRYGDLVNLERAMPANGRFGGHFVQGHVDGTGKIVSMGPEGEATLMKIAAPREIMHYMVEKGFIAVDGVSLTITHCDAASFAVSLVGYTQQHTTLGRKRPGGTVNLEVDIMAKYIEKISKESRAGVSLEFLGEHGFLAT